MSLDSQPVAWMVSAALALVFVLVNAANVSLFVSTVRNRAGGGTSPIVMVGGVAGALALWFAPVAGLREYFWVALIVDLGTGPVLLMTLLGTFFSGFKAGGWASSVPFLRYLFKPPAPAPPPAPARAKSVIGCLLGTAVGDAMGLAFEGLSRQRQQRMCPRIAGYRFLWGMGFGSDDTEHACMLAQSLIEVRGHAADGATAIALAAHFAARDEAPVTPRGFLQACSEHLSADAPMLDLIGKVTASVERGEDCEQFADSMGCETGVSGYIRHTVPMVLHVWLNHQDDFEGGVLRMVRLGGDSDTTAAILGAIIGAHTCKAGIPAAWIKHFRDWPRSITWMEKLGTELAAACEPPLGRAQAPIANPLALLVRNVVFLVVVLAHGFRRLLPPY